MAKRIKTLQEWEPGLPPVELWKEMLSLIYTGNASSAWSLIDRAWPKELTGKEVFISEFKNMLKESPYWAEIEKLNCK